jgi:DUF971 family protein
MSNDAPEPWPDELRVRDNGRLLQVTFIDGVVGSVSSERLRAASPSAENRHAPPVARPNVAIVEVEQVGNYAVRIVFDDGHDTGIYSWRLLKTLTTQ